MAEKPLLSLRDLTMVYHTRKGPVSAVDGVSFDMYPGQSMGLVGESGCGKTSVAMTMMKLLPDNAEIVRGEILLNGRNLVPLSNEEMRKVRWEQISMVFQAAMNALNPVYRVGDQIVEALEEHNRDITPAEGRKRVEQLFRLVGIDPAMADRYPHEYSGGMRQRAIIAMALACSPDLIIADEPTTALDVIVQDQVLRELRAVQQKLGMSMIYISHDIAVIAEVAETIGVMYAGRMAELGPASEIFRRPRHPYTVALMSAFPSIVGEKRELEALGGEPPDLLYPPPGCRFHPRCPRALDKCKEVQPPFENIGNQHYIACWNPAEVE